MTTLITSFTANRWKGLLYEPIIMNVRFLIVACLILLLGCGQNKTGSLPSSDLKTPDELPVDSSSIVGLYKYIFSTRCNVNGCHDGSFEPNFTTIQNAYYTLVYHPINKNNSSKSYKYRVVPYDTSHSVLYARISNCCFVNRGDQMPQINEKDKLNATQISCVGRWIMNGAKNIDGKTMELKDSTNK